MSRRSKCAMVTKTWNMSSLAVEEVWPRSAPDAEQPPKMAVYIAKAAARQALSASLSRRELGSGSSAHGRPSLPPRQPEAVEGAFRGMSPGAGVR